MSEETISKKIVAFEEMKKNRHLLYYALGGIASLFTAVATWVDTPSITYGVVGAYGIYSAWVFIKTVKRNNYLAQKYGLENKPLFNGIQEAVNQNGNTTDKPKQE